MQSFNHLWVTTNDTNKTERAVSSGKARVFLFRSIDTGTDPISLLPLFNRDDDDEIEPALQSQK